MAYPGGTGCKRGMRLRDRAGTSASPGCPANRQRCSSAIRPAMRWNSRRSTTRTGYLQDESLASRNFAGAVALALILGALFFQYVLNYPPCEMCHWQRWPHIAAAVLGLGGGVLLRHLKSPLALPLRLDAAAGCHLRRDRRLPRRRRVALVAGTCRLHDGLRVHGDTRPQCASAAVRRRGVETLRNFDGRL